jgi:hypothetical protein
MAQWIEPVFDRVQSDVDFAISKIQEWKRTGSTDTYDLKGCLNVSDINRIEGDIQYLSDVLSSLYYFPHTTTKVWGTNGLPTVDDTSRIIQNVRDIISAYYQVSAAPELPDTLLTYTDINALEENLYLIKQIIEDMVLSFRECGTFNCGEE